MRERGCVKWFNNRLGWGFIVRGNGDELFVHYDQISGEGYRRLQSGDRVVFEARRGSRGLYATAVERAPAAAEAAARAS